MHQPGASTSDRVLRPPRSDKHCAVSICAYDEEHFELQHTLGTLIARQEAPRPFDKTAFLFGNLTRGKLRKQKKHWKGQQELDGIFQSFCLVMVCSCGAPSLVSLSVTPCLSNHQGSPFQDGVGKMSESMCEYLNVLMNVEDAMQGQRQAGRLPRSIFEFIPTPREVEELEKKREKQELRAKREKERRRRAEEEGRAYEPQPHRGTIPNIKNATFIVEFVVS